VPEHQKVEALAVATRALARRDFSERGLRSRLERAGVGSEAADEALELLRHAGLVDDQRFAARRAEALAERGWGDAAIRFDLERQGVGGGPVDHALTLLAPERERVERIVSRQGAGPRTARLLARRGFGEELVEVVGSEHVALGP
jgi:SOS response regulatory protein OraA/RecX